MFAVDLAKWQVLWVADRKVVRIECGTNFAEALRVYTKAVIANKTAATLRCKNLGWAPPPKLLPYTQLIKKGKKGASDTERRVVPMAAYNLRGAWWCPYCCQIRKFVKRDGFLSEGNFVAERGYHCPMCDISHRDFHVKKWNPVAHRLQVDGVPRGA